MENSWQVRDKVGKFQVGKVQRNKVGELFSLIVLITELSHRAVESVTRFSQCWMRELQRFACAVN